MAKHVQYSVDLLEATALELQVVNEIITATNELIEEQVNNYRVLNTAQVRKEIRVRCSPEHLVIIDLLLHKSHDDTRHEHAFGGAKEGERCSHPMGCESIKLKEEHERILLRFKLNKLLDMFTFQKEHLLPESCGGTTAPENMKWWCALHNRQKSDSLAWFLSEGPE